MTQAFVSNWTFAQPEWFILLLVFLTAGIMWRRLQLFRPLRITLLLLLVLVLVGLSVSKSQKALDLFVLVDQSASAEKLLTKNLTEWKSLLESSKPSKNDQLIYLDFANEVQERETNDRGIYSGKRTRTNINLAIQHALALQRKDRPSRILLFSDGYATSPLVDAANSIKKEGVPLDFRLFQNASYEDYAITELKLPARVYPGEPYIMSLTVRGHKDGNIPVQLVCNGQKLDIVQVPIKEGVGHVEFTTRTTQPGAHHYQAEILLATDEGMPPIVDTHSGNNSTQRWVEVIGGSKVLLFTKYLNDPLAQVLKGKNYQVKVLTAPQNATMQDLAGTRAVIFNNVPAYEFNPDFLEALPFFVHEQGGGLLMVGGKYSFGAGGYYQSAIDKLLPVTMELKNEHRKLSVALALVLDNSGSMGASIAGGMSKMDLANNGSAEAIKLLGAMDKIALFAVDSEPDKVIPLTQIRDRKARLQRRALRVKAGGGGIFVYRGLKAAWDELKKEKLGTKHIILFSDAADSEEPGNYKALLKKITKAGATVSVIGLGLESDVDAPLLKDIAKRGGGRAFFSNQAVDLPKLFAQETVTIARSTFLEEPVAPMASAQWAEISADFPNWPEKVDGYNLSYLRPEASLSLASKDEYVAPLVAQMRLGLGRTAAVSFPLGGAFSERTRAWAGYGNFVQSLLNWLRGEEMPEGLGVRSKVEGTRLTLDLFYKPEEWNDVFAQSPPKIRLIGSERNSKKVDIPWQRVAPGRFSLSYDIPEGELLRGALQAGPHALSLGPFFAGNEVEWSFDVTRLNELKEVSRQSGGRELHNISEAWKRPAIQKDTSIRPLLLSVFLGLFLLEVLVTRTGWQFSQILPTRKQKMISSKGRKISPPPSKSPKASPASAASSEEKASPSPPPEIAPEKRRSRFAQAKRRK